MKFTFFLLIAFILTGCIAPRVPDSELPGSDDNLEAIVPPWDERIEPLTPSWDDRTMIAEPRDSNPPDDSMSSETPNDSVIETLAEDDIGYHFRKTRWGFSRERVELSEVGNTVLKRTPEAIVYRAKVNGINCSLVYTFEKNKLRTAGYITSAPVPNAENLRKAVVDKYGPPDGQETYEEGPNQGLEEMIWTTPHTVIFSNLYPTVTKQTLTPYDRTDGGLLKGLIEKQRAETRSGDIVYYTGVHAHIDKAFFYKLQELRYPLDELSSYEKQLMGVAVKGKRTIIPGVGTIPR